MNKGLRLFYLLIVLTLSVGFCSAGNEYYLSTSFHEPATQGLRFIYSKDGYHWDSIPGVWLKPEVGKQKVMRDPSIVMSPDGVYHLVWTSSWKGDLGFGYSTSRDLIHWTKERMIMVMEKEPTTVNVWAPEVYYDKYKKDFIVVWASCVPNRFPRGIEDVKNNHRLYYITTKDFKTISDTKLMYDPGFSSIDATIFQLKRHKYVMVFKDNTRPNRDLKVAFAKSPLGPWGKASKSFTHSYSEGPTVIKVKNSYLIYFDEYKMFAFGAVKTKDFIHFTNISNEVSVPKGHKHGTMIKVPAKLVQNLLKESKLRAEK